MGESDTVGPLLRTIGVVSLLVGLVVVSYQILRPFFSPVAWAVVLTYVTWPLYQYLCRWLPRRPGLSAFLMTLFLTAVFALPILWVLIVLRTELPDAYQAVAAYLTQEPQPFPQMLAGIPWLGPELEKIFAQLSDDRRAFNVQLGQWTKMWIDEIAGVLGDVGVNTFKFGFALITAFFFYREGEIVLDQTRRVLLRFLGERSIAYLRAIGDTTRAVLYGLVLAALAQGLLASLGYWAADVPGPVLLGAVTAVFALIPFGTPLIWGAIGLWLLLTERTFAGIGLLLWGALVVSQIDNFIRPMLISSATHIPYLLVLFGVLGGIGAFGLIGLFLGPVVVAVLLAIWREWLEEQAPSEPSA